MPTHCGFGSTTALRLACLEILLVVNGHEPAPQLLRRLSKRGGTSGIGVNTYFDGGLIVDLGIKSNGRTLVPSSISEADPIAPTRLLRAELPDWPAGIVVPASAEPLSEAQEQQFFTGVQPASQSDVERILYHAVFGVAAAVLEGDQTTFASAVAALQECIWKRREIALYGTSVHHERSELVELGATAVAMSSLGPGLFFLSDDPGAIAAHRLDIGAASIAAEVTFRNAGRIREW
ncbi:MAG TPA: hypothetical protein VEY93_16200, partial [Longimicrobium sp.]|nr:hypothetical protein [Longimicrobium sp.]